MSVVIQFLVGLFASCIPDALLLWWFEDNDRAAWTATLLSFVATGVLVSLFLYSTGWPAWVNWVVGFAAAFLYLVAVFAFSWWRLEKQKRTGTN